MNQDTTITTTKYTFFQRTAIRTQNNWRRFREGWQLFAKNRIGLIGIGLLILFLLMPLTYEYLINNVWNPMIYDPLIGFDFNLMHPAPISPDHLLGTDIMGHDVFSLLLASSLHTITIGIMAAFTAAIIGTLVGAISGYFRGRFPDIILSNLAEALILIPAPLFMVMLGSRFRDMPPWTFGIIYGCLVGFSNVGMALRSLALTITARPFISAARVSGGGKLHIIFRHIIPQMVPMSVLYMMLTVTGAVVADGFISFFGFTRATSNWGSMVYTGFTNAHALGQSVQWNVLIPPALCLSFFAAAFYFISISLQEIIDPRLRKR